MITKGKCEACRMYFTWESKLGQLRQALCPVCYRLLARTSYQTHLHHSGLPPAFRSNHLDSTGTKLKGAGFYVNG